MSIIDADTKRAKIQQLQFEIDKLALLVYEAKKQGDRIQAAADALGEPILAHLDIAPSIRSDYEQPGKSSRSRLRSRTLKS